MLRDRAFLCMVAVWTLLCAFLGAREIVDLDAVPLALALEHQDLNLHQPQPPGSILHVWLAQVLHAFGIAGFPSLRIVSWAVLAAAAHFLFLAVRRTHAASTARWAVALFLSSPLVLFHGMTAGTLGDEALVASLTLFLCLRALSGPARGLRFEAYLLGLLAGLRPTTLVFSLPLLLWTAKKLGLRRRSGAAAGLAWFLGMACWLVPQADLAGGFDDYLAVNAALLQPLLQASPLAQGPLALLRSLGTPLSALLLGLGVFRLLASLVASPKNATGLDRGLVLVWALPIVALGLLLGFRHSGAMLALWPLLCVSLATGWTRLTTRHGWAQPLLLAVLALDLAMFFWIPTASTHGTAPRRAAHATAAEFDADAPAPADEDLSQPENALPGILQRRAALLLERVDFFHDRVRRAPFDAFLQALETLPEDETLLLGCHATRAACLRFPTRDILHADPLRPLPFLRYRNGRPTRVDSVFVVPSHVAWLLLEGSREQLAVAPPVSETQRPVRPLSLRSGLVAFPIGRQRLDAWFTPRASVGARAPEKLHLWREGLLDDPALFERTAIDP